MKAVVHRAGWVLVDPATVFPDARVTVVGGRVLAVEPSGGKAADVDHGPGLIMPGLVNAHTHLSLSALSGRLRTDGGFRRWVEDLMAAREGVTPDEAAAAAREAAVCMHAGGVVLAAEVGPLEGGAEVLRQSGLEALVFAESLGAGEGIEPLPADEAGLWFSWAGHGLHTTSPARLQALKRAARARGRPFGLHLAESEDETAFLLSGQGAWADLMVRKGHELSRWLPWGERPVERALRLGLLDPMTLAVHLIDATAREMDALAQTGCRVCLCPRSNRALHGRLPDAPGWVRRGVYPALGTDSLASVASLSLFEEMAFAAAQFPGLSPETIVAMATVNGAEALGRPELGTLRPGSSARLLYVDLAARDKRQLLERLVNAGEGAAQWRPGPRGSQAAAAG